MIYCSDFSLDDLPILFLLLNLLLLVLNIKSRYILIKALLKHTHAAKVKNIAHILKAVTSCILPISKYTIIECWNWNEKYLP